MGDCTTWDARAWLNEVREAVRMLQVERDVRSLRKESLYSIGDPLAHEHTRSGSIPDAMHKVDIAIDSEHEFDERMEDLRREVDSCERVVVGLHNAGMDDEAWAVELHVIYRMSWQGVARKMTQSSATVRRRYDVAVDVMETVGKARAVAGDLSLVKAEQ